MNKNFYKTIFSKTRGEMIAVAENVSVAGQSSNRFTGDTKIESMVCSVNHCPRLVVKALSFSMLLVTGAAVFSGSMIAHAGIVADGNAAANQRPTIINTANGVTQVNIQTPSQAGVSMNQYQQFDVNQKGVILNNSHQNTQTQLAGYIQANPWLAGGEAKVIVNQVNSSNPSQLNGYVEVGGRRADVIIANQAGINVDGSGFINANQVTLTTGNPLINNGQVTGFQIRDGLINITGKGLDTSQADYTQLLSRAAQINAGVWAKDLNIITGQNDVDANKNVTTKPSTTNSNAPQFAIDTGSLGGMYAGKISLVSTEKGLGINNVGQVFASAGSIHISADGQLNNTGAVVAQDKNNPSQATLDIQAQSLNNSGSLSSLDKQSIQTNNLRNSGLIATSAELKLRNQDSLLNQGDINAGRLDIETQQLNNQSGNIVQTGLQDLNLQATHLNNSNQGLIGYTELDNSTGSGGISTGSGQTGTAPSTATGGGSTSEANTTVATSLVQGRIQADWIDNNMGKITANGGVDLSVSQSLENRQAQLKLNKLNSQGSDFKNIEGDVHAQKADIQANTIENTRGNLQVDQQLKLKSDQLLNQAGQIVAGKNLTVETGDIQNQQGKLLSSEDNSIQAQNIDNQAGQILANQDVTVQAKSITADGELASGRNLSLNLQDSFTTKNKIVAGNQLSISIAGDLTNNTDLQAGNNIQLNAKNIDNQATGRIVAENAIQISSENLTNRGEINSNGQTLIEATGKINNIGTGKIYGNHVAIATNELVNQQETLENQTKAAVIAARQQLDIGVQSLTNKEGGLISSEGDLAIAGQLSTSKTVEGQALSVNNNSAKIEAGNDLSINSQGVRNTNEHFATELKQVDQQHVFEYEAQGQNQRYAEGSQDTLGWSIRNNESDHMVTPDGVWHENWHKYDYDRTTQQTQVTDSAPGQIIAGGNLKITGTSLLNSDSQILAGKALMVDVKDLVNQETLGQTIVSDEGVIHNYYRDHKKGRDETGEYTSSYHPAPVATDLHLGVFAYQEHAQLANTPNTTDILTIKSDQQDDIRIRSMDVNTTLPNSSLFSINPNNTQYLIETDLSFTNYRKWLSSDYMLTQLQQDPTNFHKRLGDGYYEQKLINQQINQLTGRRFLEGYSSDEDQYQQLMQNGVSAAKAMNLTVGIALSAEQIARLTTDIVWLVEKSVKLADGTTTTVLAPQVYVRVQAGDINGSGSLLAGNNTLIDVEKSLSNGGTIAGRQALVINANRIDNLGGRISANRLSANAQTDINNIGGVIDAKQQLLLNAGQNINVVSTINTTANEQGSNTHINRRAGVYVTGKTGEGILSLQAGKDIQLKAGDISNASAAGITQLVAQNKIEIGTVEVSQKQANIQDADNYIKRSEHGEIGSTLQATNDIQLKAGQELHVRGSEINSEQGNVAAQAKNINIESGEYTKIADDALKSTSKGTFSSSTYRFKDSASNTQAVASVIGGKNIALQADQDIKVKGSQVIADQDTHLNAKNNINIEAATTNSTEQHLAAKEKSGLFSSGGIGFTIGKIKETTDNQTQKTNSTASTVGSLKGDTQIIAGQNYQQTGSTVSAQQGDVNIYAQQVNIGAAKEQSINDYQHEREQKGFTLAVNVPVVSAIQTAANAVQQVGKSKNDRVNAMATANAGFDAYQAGQSLAQLKDAATSASSLAQGANVSVSITYGQQKDSNFSKTTSAMGASSQVYAGGKTNIVATGAGDQSNINIIGSNVLGKQGTNLTADHDINIKSFEQTTTERSGNKSEGFNAGVAISYGSNGFAFGVTAGGNLGKGTGNGDESSHLNSHVGSQDSLTNISSGNATNIQGGQVQGKGVTLTAKELNIESLQDKATYKAKQQNISGQATVGYGASVSGSYSQSNINANYASVTEQSGIFAGDDGYQINVKNNTDLKGAVITSNQKAEDTGKNSLNTGTLTASDIHNITEYDAKGIGVSGNVSVSGETLGQKAPQKGDAIQLQNVGNKGSSKSIGFGLDSDKDSSVTRSGINTKNITIQETARQEELTGKTAEQAKADIYTTTSTETAKENSGALSNNFDKDKVLKEINTQVSVTQQFDTNRQAVKQEIYNKVDKMRAEAEDIRRNNYINGKNGYNTAESLKLEADANKLEKYAFYVDSTLDAIYGYGNTTALSYVGTATVTDPVKRAATMPTQIWEVKCNGDSLYCADANLDKSTRPLESGKAQIGDKRQIFDIQDIKPSQSTGVVTISNNGIMNPLDDALKNAVKQNLWNTDKEGVFVVYNPPTTNLISELIYAAYDKNNDLLGGRLPLTNAEKTNIELYQYAKDSGYLIDLSNHSRGGLTASVAIQNANRNGLTEMPLNQARFYGTATNVQDYSNWLIENNKFINSETGNSTGVYSAVHQADFVGRPSLILGGNPSTGGDCWLCYSHSSYSAEIPSEYLVSEKEQYIDKKGNVTDKPTPNPYADEYKQKWGDNYSKNLSLPKLVPSQKLKEVVKYEINPF